MKKGVVYDPTKVADQFIGGSRNGCYLNQWLVAGTKPGVVYTISKRWDGAWECSCPRWIYFREECKHIHAARIGQAFLTEGTPVDLCNLAEKLKSEDKVNSKPWEK